MGDGRLPESVMVGALTVSEMVELVKLTLPVPVLLSVPETVKVKLPVAVVVPEIVPLLFKLRPLGSAPLASAVEKL